MEQYTNHNDLALEVNGATKIFGGVTVLDHVNFSLRKGEVHILIGENGAGKSTLIKIIAGAYIPNAGIIKLNGETITVNSPLEALERGITRPRNFTTTRLIITSFRNLEASNWKS